MRKSPSFPNTPLSSSSSSRKWNFYQILGHRPPDDYDGMVAFQDDDGDGITAIQFDKGGDYLAVGDEAGRVVILERDRRNNVAHYNEETWPHLRRYLEELDSAPGKRPKFRFKSQFYSHEAEVDYRSVHYMSQRIKKVCWSIVNNGLMSLLSANSRRIKLWTLKEREIGKFRKGVNVGRNRFLSSENVLISQGTYPSANGSHVEWTENLSQENQPDDDETTTFLRSKCHKIYGPPHSSNINSLSTNSDAMTFISADDYKINLWKLDVSDYSYSIIDMKERNALPPFEKVTSAGFHPEQCNLVAYGTSRGVIHVCDLRQSPKCDRSAHVFRDRPISRVRINHYEEMAASISDVKFLDDDNGGGLHQLISRDYLHMKLWDARYGSHPVETFRVHEHLRHRLADLHYEGYLNIDRFDCCYKRDHDGRLCFATGSYTNRLKIFSQRNRTVEDIKLDVIGDLDWLHVLPKGTVRRSPIISNTQDLDLGQGGGATDGDEDLDSRVLRVAWHPKSNLVATVIQNNKLMLYHV